MKNITVTLSGEIDQMARIWAAQHNTTVTALVRNFLESLNLDPSPRLIPPRAASSPPPISTLQLMNGRRQIKYPPSPPFPVKL